jgi:hypothetical protein
MLKGAAIKSPNTVIFILIGLEFEIFLLYINDLHLTINSVPTPILFADDASTV